MNIKEKFKKADYQMPRNEVHKKELHDTLLSLKYFNLESKGKMDKTKEKLNTKKFKIYQIGLLGFGVVVVIVGVFLILNRNKENITGITPEYAVDKESVYVVEGFDSGSNTFISSLFVEDGRYIVNKQGIIIKQTDLVPLINFLLDTDETFRLVEDITEHPLVYQIDFDAENANIYISDNGVRYLIFVYDDKKLDYVINFVAEDVSDEQDPVDGIISPDLDIEEDEEIEITYNPTIELYEISNTGIYTYDERDGAKQLIYNAWLTDMVGATCEFTITDIVNNTVVYQNTVIPNKYRHLGDWVMDISEGKYLVKVECDFMDEVYSIEKNLEVIKSPVSVCDDANFNFAEPKALDGINSLMNGVWKGCTSNPWTSNYRVRFDFRQDGTYSSENIEVSENPNSVRDNVALYYGTDKDSSFKTWSISDSYEGSSNGWIGIAFDTGGASQGLMRNIYISEDGNTMYFEVMHRSQYGPMKYMLTKE